MPLYRYQALDTAGRLEGGVLEAPDEPTLYEALKQRGLFLVKARKGKPLFAPRKVKARHLIEFARNMDYIIRAGIPILEGLEEAARGTRDQLFREVLFTVLRDIQAGQSMSEALRAHPGVFSPFFISVIRAGEASGQLDRAFRDLATYLEWTENLKARVKQALTYPVIVIVLVSVALVIFATFVIPKLVRFVQELGRPLPLTTRVLIGAQELFSRWWFVFPLLILGLFLFFALSRKIEWFRYKWDQLKLRLPVFGELFLTLSLTRFLRYAEMLYKAGIQVYDLLAITREVLRNRALEEKLDRVRGLVMEGQSLSQAMDQAELFPSLVRRSIRVGERTGDLERVLGELGRQYDEELDRGLRRLVSLVEPALLIVIAGVIISIIVAVIWPIYTLLGEIR